MKSIKVLSAVFLSVVFISTSVFALAAASVKVIVKDPQGAPITGAIVGAMIFDTMGNPKPADPNDSTIPYTKIGVTDVNGECTLALSSSTSYIPKPAYTGPYVIIVASQGYSPTIYDYTKGIATSILPVVESTDAIRNVTLTKLAVDVGRVHLNVTLRDPFIAAADAMPYVLTYPTLVVANIRNKNILEDVAYGIGYLTSNPGTLEIYNVPVAPGGTYEIGVFWPVANLGTNLPIDVSLDALTPLSFNLDLSLNNPYAMAPQRAATTAPTPTTTGILPDIQGIVMDISSRPVANANVNLSCQFRWEFGMPLDMGSRYTMTDSNGFYAFYDLPRNATTNTLYLYFSVNAQGYEGADFRGAKDLNGYDMGYPYIYCSTSPSTSIVSFDWVNNRPLKPANGIISGVVRLKRGVTISPLPYGWVNVYGDNTRWTNITSTAPFDNFYYPDINPWDSYSKSGRGGGGGSINNGNFQISGLPKGNYTLNIQSDFSQYNIEFNKGANNQYDTETSSFMVNGSVFTRHSVTGDDIRITVDDYGQCRVYSSSGNYRGNSVVVDIPAEPPALQSATIQGKITLVGVDPAVGISNSAPITIIARQDWNSFIQNGMITDEIAISTSDGPNVVVYTKKQNINSYSVVVKSSASAIITDFTGPVDMMNQWVQPDLGKIVWTPGALSRPAPLDTVKISYSYMGRPKTNFKVISGVGTVFNYAFQVPNTIDDSTNTYKIEMRTTKLGINWSGGDLVADISKLPAGTTVYILPDLTAMPAGSIIGIVKKPNGELFKPLKGDKYIGMSIEANNMETGSYGWSELKDDGSFEVAGLLPGTYQLRARTNYNQSDPTITKLITWAETKVNDIVVSTVTPTNVVVQLKDGVILQPIIDMSKILTTELYNFFYVPPPPMYSGSKSGLAIIGFPTGTQLTNQNLMKLLINEPDLVISYDYTNSKTRSTNLVPEGNYDLYAVANASVFENYSKGFMFTTIAAEKKSVIVDKTLSGTTDYMTVAFPDPTIGDASITGVISGINLITQKDVPILKNSFMKILDYIPTIMLYDSNGRLAAFASQMSGMSQNSDKPFRDAIASGDLTAIKNIVAASGMYYTIKFLKPGTYTATIYNPNYPMYTKVVTLASGDNRVDINLDNVAGASVKISGTVNDSVTSQKIPGATVVVNGPKVEKTATTDSNGSFTIDGLMKGVYLVNVKASGYAPQLKKVFCPETSITPYPADFSLKQAGGTIGGTIYVSKGLTSSTIPKEPVKIIAFNLTAVNSARNALVPLQYGWTETSSGTYRITSIVYGDTYLLAILVPGNKIEAVIGVLSSDPNEGFLINGIMPHDPNDVSFILKYLPPSFEIKQLAGNTSIDFTIKSMKALKDKAKPTITYSVSPYTGPGTAVSAVYESTGNANTWVCSISLDGLVPTQDYTMKVYGMDSVPNKGVYVSTEAFVSFGAKIKARAQVSLDEIQYTGGDIQVDDTLSDPSAITIPIGGVESGSGFGATSLSAFSALGVDDKTLEAKGIKMEAQSASVGGFAMFISKLAKATAGDPGNAKGLISDIYDLGIQNGTIKKDLTLTLSYNASANSVTDTTKLSIKKYNDATGKWETVEGVTSITGNTISVDISTIASVSASALHVMAASGTKYAVFYTTATTPTTNPYNGTEIRVYNFPNPFDLTAKTVALAATSNNATISGTMIKLSLPLVANNVKVVANSNYKYEIYNIAGELVRIIDLGIQTPGTYVYQEWDGKNDNGENCASGVYLLLIRQGTTKLLDKAVKIAIIK